TLDRIELLDAWEDADNNDPRRITQVNYQATLATIQQEYDQALAQLEQNVPLPPKPEKPRQRNIQLQTIDLDFLESFGTNQASQALRTQYEGAIWQMSANSPPIPTNAARLEWEDVQITAVSERQYELKLIRADRTLTLLVEPAIQADAYESALENYRQQYKAYERALSERKNNIAEQKKAILEVARVEAQQATVDFEAYLKANNTNVRPLRRKVVNKFKATSLGIWNCDRPILPSQSGVVATFRDAKTGETYANQTGYLVDQTKNTIYHFLVAERTPLIFDRSSKNLLWLVTGNGQLAVFRPEDFEQLTEDVVQHTFQLKVLPQKVARGEDVRRLLQI
ncbi:MAG: hypothetical protein AAF738_11605, partial [Bacteroidota bacterium]